MVRGVHGEKIVAARASEKLPKSDEIRLDQAVERYDSWKEKLYAVEGKNLDEVIVDLVNLLNEYKYYIDVEVIFDSQENFLYRQKGQLKLDNTIVEEFLPIFVKKCLITELGQCDLQIGSQVATFSSSFFASSLSNPEIGGWLNY